MFFRPIKFFKLKRFFFSFVDLYTKMYIIKFWILVCVWVQTQDPSFFGSNVCPPEASFPSFSSWKSHPPPSHFIAPFAATRRHHKTNRQRNNRPHHGTRQPRLAPDQPRPNRLIRQEPSEAGQEVPGAAAAPQDHNPCPLPEPSNKVI